MGPAMSPQTRLLVASSVISCVMSSCRRRLSSFLRSYSPGPEVIPALEAWEQDRGEALIDPMPIDPQLQQALDLLAATTPAESAGK